MTISRIRSRLTDLGLSEATIYKVGDRRITVEIPAISDPEEAVQKLGSTAQLEFRDADDNVMCTAPVHEVQGAVARGGP